MKKSLIALAAVATVALTTVATPTPADARNRTWGYIGAGVAGAVIGGALLGQYAYPRAYYPVTGYEPYPTYYVAAPYQCPGGYWARRPIRDGYGNVIGWSKPRWFCPY
ncbi:MAG: hypothetical protein HY659_00055 [Rhizobiales bacterium]|nr:hypothetical protein [Hyphomicrobiales bacterium]